RFLSGDDPMRVFAAGRLTNVLTIEVRWRSGRVSVVRDVAPNRLYEIDEAGSRIAPSFQELELRSPTRRERTDLSPRARLETGAPTPQSKGTNEPGIVD